MTPPLIINCAQSSAAMVVQDHSVTEIPTSRATMAEPQSSQFSHQIHEERSLDCSEGSLHLDFSSDQPNPRSRDTRLRLSDHRRSESSITIKHRNMLPFSDHRVNDRSRHSMLSLSDHSLNNRSRHSQKNNSKHAPTLPTLPTCSMEESGISFYDSFHQDYQDSFHDHTATVEEDQVYHQDYSEGLASSYHARHESDCNDRPTLRPKDRQGWCQDYLPNVPSTYHQDRDEIPMNMPSGRVSQAGLPEMKRSCHSAADLMSLGEDSEDPPPSKPHSKIKRSSRSAAELVLGTIGTPSLLLNRLRRGSKSNVKAAALDTTPQEGKVNEWESPSDSSNMPGSANATWLSSKSDHQVRAKSNGSADATLLSSKSDHQALLRRKSNNALLGGLLLSKQREDQNHRSYRKSKSNNAILPSQAGEHEFSSPRPQMGSSVRNRLRQELTSHHQQKTATTSRNHREPLDISSAPKDLATFPNNSIQQLSDNGRSLRRSTHSCPAGEDREQRRIPSDLSAVARLHPARDGPTKSRFHKDEQGFNPRDDHPRRRSQMTYAPHGHESYQEEPRKPQHRSFDRDDSCKASYTKKSPPLNREERPQHAYVRRLRPNLSNLSSGNTTITTTSTTNNNSHPRSQQGESSFSNLNNLSLSYSDRYGGNNSNNDSFVSDLSMSDRYRPNNPNLNNSSYPRSQRGEERGLDDSSGYLHPIPYSSVRGDHGPSTIRENSGRSRHYPSYPQESSFNRPNSAGRGRDRLVHYHRQNSHEVPDLGPSRSNDLSLSFSDISEMTEELSRVVSSDANHHSDAARGGSNKSQDLVEVFPGVQVPFRRAQETQEAVSNNFYMPVSCLTCQDMDLYAIADVAYFVCPLCKIFCNVEGDSFNGKPVERHGLGLGFTTETLFSLQAEIMGACGPARAAPDTR